jgi:hypothetical protein
MKLKTRMMVSISILLLFSISCQVNEQLAGSAIITTTGGMLSVQAAPPNSTDVEFELKSYPEAPRPLCPRQQLKIYVSVSRSIHRTINGTDRLLFDGPVSGVVVRGSVTDSHIGTLTPPESSGSYGLADLTPGDADFVFTAKKAGTTILKFDGEVGSYWVGTGATETLPNSYRVHVEVPVKVIPCKYKVSTVQQSVIEGPAGFKFSPLAMIDGAEMTEDQQVHFTGTAPVNWVGGTSNTLPCNLSVKFAPTTQASLAGDINDSGQLVANLTFPAPEASLTMACFGASNTVPYVLSADPLRFSVPFTGGAVTLSQGFLSATGMVPGSAVIVVIPEEDQVAAFNPDSQAALSSSGWRTMLWDNFPWPHNVLLALH